MAWLSSDLALQTVSTKHSKQGLDTQLHTSCLCFAIHLIQHSAIVTPVLGWPAASADSSARVWDMEIGDCVLLMEGHTAAVTDVAVAEEGSLLVTSSADHTARVWGLDKGQCRAVLQGHTAAVNAVVVDARGRFAVTASADATGRVWDLHSGQCAHVLRGHGAGAAGAGLLSADSCAMPCTCLQCIGQPPIFPS